MTPYSVLCIAHRIKTIINYDRVLVMGAGNVEEFDTPLNLYKAGGIFHKMCVASGIDESDILATQF
jgi:ATP-binding cassette subfamily C (CFTR/MRP) protein 1